MPFKRLIMPEIVSGGFGLAGAGMSMANNTINYKHQQELMDKSHQQALEMWRLQNEYMSPKNQMQRMKEAGLNPDLIYGKGDFSSSTMPNSSAPAVSPRSNPVIDGINTANSIRLSSAQVKKEEAEADLASSNAKLARTNDQESIAKGKREQESHDWDRFTRKLQDDLLISEALFKDYQSRNEYQKGVRQMLENASMGYRPKKTVGPDGKPMYDVNDFGYEFYNQIDEAHNIINEISLEYDIREYDKKYLIKCFDDMVALDLKSLQQDLLELENKGIIEQFKSDHDWFVFFEYFLDRLLGTARTAAGVYSSMSTGRLSSKRAGVYK